MNPFSLFLALLCTSAVIAHGGSEMSKGKSEKSDKKHAHTHKTTIETECKEIIALEKLELFAANATELADKTHNNATKIAEIKTKASDGATRLAALKGNATLVKDCAIIAAAEELEHECREIEKLEKFIRFADNSTAVADKTKNNATKIAEIKAEASKDATELQKLETNATLVKLCVILAAAEREKHECEEIKKLETFIAFADNSTAVADKTKNNGTKAADIHAQASRDATVLAKLKSNATLVFDCAALATSEMESLASMSSVQIKARRRIITDA
jgi:hypothetical protein